MKFIAMTQGSKKHKKVKTSKRRKVVKGGAIAALVVGLTGTIAKVWSNR